MPCQNGECAASACSTGSSARIRLNARIAVAGSGIPTWMCSAQVGVRRKSPRICAAISW